LDPIHGRIPVVGTDSRWIVPPDVLGVGGIKQVGGDDALEQVHHGQDGMEPEGFRVVFLLVFRGTEIGDFEADIPITVLEGGGSC
jgi:hypothetical protein